MKTVPTGVYGSREWMNAQYAGTVDDPWGLAWRGSQRYRYLKMLDAVQRHLPPAASGLRIVDIGCATGIFTAMLDTLGDPETGQTTGVDISETAIERARASHPGIDFACMDIVTCAENYAGACDVVTCLEVIYYLPEEKRRMTLQQIRGMLKPGGLLLVSSMVASSPYFREDSLTALVKAELPVIETGVLYLKPLVLWEKLLMKFGATSTTAGQRSRAGLVDRLGRRAPALTRSHAFVLARRTDEP